MVKNCGWGFFGTEFSGVQAPGIWIHCASFGRDSEFGSWGVGPVGNSVVKKTQQ